MATASSSIGQALRRGVSVLSESSVSGRADALILLGYVLERPRQWIVAHGDAEITDGDFALFVDVCRARRLGKPLAYITGSAWFYGREFSVDESVLIPRPETEHLVEEAIRFVRDRDFECRVLDVGTGSGAIACSIGAETNALVDATDVSPAAVAIAGHNAQRHGVGDRCWFHHGSLVERVVRKRYDVIVANLPYIPTSDLPQPPDPVSFEPREALDGGPDGLKLYRHLLPELPNLLKEAALVLLEAAPPTIQALRNLTQISLPNFTISVGHDYAGLARYIRAET